MHFFSKILPGLFFIAMTMSFFSCEDDWQAAEKVSFSFSKDTLTFDTVFTTLGSATSKILVYNNTNKELNISDVRLAGGASSYFRINVDGKIHKDHLFQNISIRAKDSMYIFVEVTIDPQMTDAPVLIRDSVVFSLPGQSKRILLEAFGQDMIILRNKLILNDTILSDKKPYLIYGDLVVDSAKTLELAAGTRLFFHNNANLLVYGNLKTHGTLEKPVILRGSRLDKIMFETPVPYNHVAGQWGGVYLLYKEGKHVLNHLRLSSGYVGLYFYNADKRYRPELEINNSIIHNFVFYNLVAINGDVVVTNSELSNSGSYTVYLNGGNHQFYHCTVANYFGLNPAQAVNRSRKPAVMMMNLNRTMNMNTVFKNCIIAGTQDNEFTIASRYLSQYQGDFSHSYIRKTADTAFTQYNNIRWYERNDTVFRQARYDIKKQIYFDFVPDSVSPARGIADPSIAAKYPLDLNGRNRLSDAEPDAGAYEWFPAVNP
jgi:hypothetical protein